MHKVVLAALCVCAGLAAAGATAAPSSDWKDVSKALKGINTREGVSVLTRLDACKIKVVQKASWVDVLAADKPEYAAKKGDTVVMVKLDFPPVPAVGSYPARPGMSGVSAMWVIGKKGVTPISTWAEQLISKPAPLATNYGLKC
jgi:hypothetical protein